MEMISAGQQNGQVIQLGFFESVAGLLSVGGAFLIGLLPIGASLFAAYRKHREIPRIRTTVLTLILYFYLYVTFTNITGIPTLSEWLRLWRLGEGLFHPNLNLTPFADGIGAGFILNIILFVPLGFLCPMIWRRI